MIPATPSVSLTRSEFAAVRAYVQGMPAAMVVPRYLADDTDDDDAGVESALRILLALRDRMVQLAHLHGRADLADLLLAGPGRSNRGMDRRVDALGELERLGTAAPQHQHSVELWFAPALARRLRNAGIVTLKSLLDLANRRGTAWWRTVPRIGALAGTAINRWLGEHRTVFKDADGAPLLQAHVGNRAPLQPAALSPGLRQPLPLEWLTEAPTGGTGGACPYSLGVTVVRAWLRDAAAGQGSTFAAYRKEAERLLLWAALERNKGLLQLDLDDRQAYLAFLASPEPASRWCGPRAPRHQAAWRPLTGALSPASQRHSLRVLAALFRWMHDNGYPCAARWPAPTGAERAMTPATAALPVRAPLPDDSLAAFLSWLAAQAEVSDGQRYRAAHAAILLLRERGLRLDQLSSATLRSLASTGAIDGSTIESATPQRGVVGTRPGDTLAPATQSALARHWQDRQLQWDGPGMEDACLIGPATAPPTGRARRKRAAQPLAGYSVRGLHALLAATLERYRKRCDPAFAARSPRDLMA
ncbi:phage integrase family protein [Cupriavidus taiwanensis]|uniref:Putative integrase/recombinase n=1 Tax=Cupriavidus taiwanensis TaxID=164546 RepID=A0A7Z7NPH3_9BURK|nr:phage integrase family protein [Cupriavidus taiwanensis]SOZ09274.1 putative integrase/recombinase [Cupriavidus taiwanensis]SOZ11399.1 putative integrase/recombinase [Cupriavidus taiwanensis]SOZ42752.1 putative integrase/recombinase [Cupriavidus taiwanensis]SPC21955.1 putative integrase/recombinase [Cupriavidus taiwanensis]SPD53478.1 putative integrase/recombinase [Cupriavidus taiwanensis]